MTVESRAVQAITAIRPRFFIGQEVALKFQTEDARWHKYTGVICGLELNKPSWEPGWVYYVDWWDVGEQPSLPIPYREEAHESELMLLSWEWLETALKMAQQFPEHWQRSKRLNAFIQLMLVIAIAQRWLFLITFMNHCWCLSPLEKRAIRQRIRGS